MSILTSMEVCVSMSLHLICTGFGVQVKFQRRSIQGPCLNNALASPARAPLCSYVIFSAMYLSLHSEAIDVLFISALSRSFGSFIVIFCYFHIFVPEFFFFLFCLIFSSNIYFRLLNGHLKQTYHSQNDRIKLQQNCQ